MNRDELTALAERVEAATGADRELGREVLRACGWTQSTHGHFFGPLTGWTSPDKALYFDDDNFVRFKFDPTEFIDAAMTLVPEGCWVRIDQWPGRKATASVQPIGEPPMDASCGVAATPALALTAACLRALAGAEQ